MKGQLFVFIILFFSVSVFGQVQLGFDIDGDAPGDGLGWSVSLSSSGDVVAIGIPFNAVNGQNEGYVRIYEWDGTSWVQRGNDIIGEAAEDVSGWSVALSSSGDVVAIGGPWNTSSGLKSGHIRVFEWDGISWVQKGGDIFSGEFSGEHFGWSVALSSTGDVVAGGAEGFVVNEENPGYVSIYEWDGTSWVKRGNDINGETPGDRLGLSVSLSSTGDVVATGAPSNVGDSSGYVRIYAWDGTSWVQRGTDINGEAAGDRSGFSISLSSSGDIVAIGAPSNDGNGENSGHVRVYTWNGSSWTQRGSDINGESSEDFSGNSVSLSSSGDIVAIGASSNDGNGENSGHVRVYTWDGTSWIQRGSDINGEETADAFGRPVSLSSKGDIVAIGAWLNDGNGENSGHVRIYRLDGLEYFPVVQVSADKDVCLTPRILPLFEYEYFQKANQVGRYIIEKDQGILIPIEDSSRIRPQVLPAFKSLPEYYLLDSMSVASRIMGTIVRDTFCLLPKESVHDVRVSITPVNRARPGFESHYILNIENIGTQQVSGTLEFYYDDAIIDYVSSMPLANQVASGLVRWDYSDLMALEKRSYEVTIKFNGPMDNPPLMGGETLVLKSKIEPLFGDIDTINNYAECVQEVVNSWDPNDKQCLSGDTLSPSNVGSELVYMIRFENEGTAEAENVIVTDYIDTLAYDINSFRLIEASHSQITQITEGNRVDFIFKGINLPFDDANNDGYVVFGIKGKASLLNGDTLKNRASIYFDYNLPIVTNDAVTIVADQPTSSKNYNKESSIKVYPNPSSETVTITSSSAIERIEVFDLSGRQMSRYVFLEGWQTQQELNVGDFTPGVYVLMVKTNEGMQQTKLIVN